MDRIVYVINELLSFLDSEEVLNSEKTQKSSPNVITYVIGTLASIALFIACLVSMIMFIKNVDLQGVSELRTNLYIYIMIGLTYLIRVIWWPLKWQPFAKKRGLDLALKILNRIAFLTNYLGCSAYVQLWLKIIASVVSAKRGKALRIGFLAIDGIVAALFLACLIAFCVLERIDKDNRGAKGNSDLLSYDVTIIVCGASSLLVALLYIIIGSWCLEIVRKTLPDLKGVTTKFIVISTILFILSVLRFIFLLYRVFTGKTMQTDCFYVIAYMICECNCIPILVMLHSAFQKQRGQNRINKRNKKNYSQKFSFNDEAYSSGLDADSLKREEELLMGADVSATEFNYQVPF